MNLNLTGNELSTLENLLSNSLAITEGLEELYKCDLRSMQIKVRHILEQLGQQRYDSE